MFSDGNFDYETVFHHMTWDEILEANAACDLILEEQENQRAKARAEAEMRQHTGRR